ncbi:hypothetical protein F511_23806 [Dorcoceras hygrometricum]|uniref:Uncharacterized protein n=1 Tax=Dorcoceras hygrometricum TaxID=472368 RepID=A0A2Z7AJP0_9LAMI|nr:hypothetical protein F511_23806 [Dorcoceras hygrometricum]
MAPSAPRTRATAALRMKQIALNNQSRTIRRLRAQLATEIRGLAKMKKELEDTQVALEASHKVIAGLTEIGLSMSKKIEKMKVKKQQAKESQRRRIAYSKQSMVQEANDAPAPFDDEWEEEPKENPDEEEIEDIPLGKGEIDDE